MGRLLDVLPFPARRSSDLYEIVAAHREALVRRRPRALILDESHLAKNPRAKRTQAVRRLSAALGDRKSTRLNSSHRCISYAVFCLLNRTRVPASGTAANVP